MRGLLLIAAITLCACASLAPVRPMAGVSDPASSSAPSSAYEAPINLLAGDVADAPGAKTDDPHAHHGKKMDGKPVYTCRMHPEVRMKAPGRCPKCDMVLVVETPDE